ncbi:unnamed protein product, partial [Phaeothamnion confervicola]
SFLYGGNAAYIEDLYARYEVDPNSVDAEWQVFFRSLKDERAEVIKNSTGPSWKRPNLISAADVQQATRDSIHALMLIRAYRIRGHFHAKLDPLGLEPEKSEEELDPRSYGFTDADMDRKIFLDKVL